MSDSTPTQLRFSPLDGFTVRADFEGGALSSDFGPLLLRGVDQQIGLTHRLARAIHDSRHASYIDHSMEDLLTQRIFQIACGYADANDANALRRDPVFKLGAERLPLEAEQDLASAPTFSRLENAARHRDLYRMAEAFVEQFVASYARPPEMIVLDMDHSEDRTHGQQELAFYNHHYQSHCYLPLFLFEGLSGKFITAALRPGKRPKGAENAMIIKRVLRRLRQHWPETHILLRGDAHFANVELVQLALDDPYTDFLFGLTSNSRLKKRAEPLLEHTRRLYETRCHNARLAEQDPPQRSRTFHELDYQARSWPKAFRTALKAEVMALGDNPRFVVTSLDDPTPEILYAELYCARGQDENFIKMMKNDLASDRTSDCRFAANHLRLFFSCAAYVLHHALRSELLQGTELARAQPSTVIIKLFKLAVRVVQYKDRVKLHLPSSCPVKDLLHTITERLYRLPRPPLNTC
jgi:hypothetical protein